MDKVGIGIFNRDMIRSIKEYWHNGGIGVTYVGFRSGHTDAESAVQLWESGEQRIFWRQRLELDYFYFFHREQKDEPILKLVERAAERLSGRLRKILTSSEERPSHDQSLQVDIGIAAAYSPSTGSSTETVIYRMLLEAIEHSAYHISLDADHRCTAVEMIEDHEGLGQAAATNEIRNQGQFTGLQGKTVRIGALAVPFPIFPVRARVSEVSYLFDMDEKAQGVVIVEKGRPIGILMKEKLHQLLAGQFGLPLYWNRTVDRIMNHQPLIVDEQLPVEHVSQLAMARDISQLYDVVLITRNGQMAGAATIRSILECMTALRTEAARGANPLTGLPGNEEIQLELQRRIEEGKPMAIIYADLDYFKWYNDFFGFGLGDNLIRYLADILSQEIKLYGNEPYFIGHIGGDDFIAVMDTAYAEIFCQSLIRRFDDGIKAFYNGIEVTTVEDRHGNVVEHEGVTLSLSLMIWDGEVPLTSDHISRFSAKLKKQAKALKGSVYVVDQIKGTHLGEELKLT